LHARNRCEFFAIGVQWHIAAHNNYKKGGAIAGGSMRISMLVMVLAPLHVLAAPVDDIRMLFESGRTREAVALGNKHPQLLGQPDFDYFYGMALIDTGEPAKGVLALERHLLHRPESLAVRAELGRGYFAMGDLPRAKEMFNEVLGRNPPPALRMRAEEYLQSIRQRESAWRTSWSGHVELGGGHDSNANSGITSEIINVPLFGAVSIDASGRAQKDRFAHTAVGAQWNVPFSAAWSAFAGLGMDSRHYRDVEMFDQRSINAAAGISHQGSANQWRLSVNGGRLEVDTEKYRTLGALTLDGTLKLSETRTLSAYLQGADIRYAGDNRVRDSRLASLGVQMRQAFEGGWQPLGVLGINGGRESNRNDRADLDRKLFGGTATLALTLSPKWGTAFSAQFQRSRYGADDALFAATRNDRYRSFDWTLGRAVTENLSARIEFSRNVNASNIELYSYTRNQFALKLRLDQR
jgi:tetratricopeptide (TPR) repeat protein